MFSCRTKHAKCCGNPKCSSFAPLDLLVAVQACQRRLSRFGIRIGVLAQRERSVLLLVYRQADLARLLAQPPVASFLEGYGYVCSSVQGALVHLSHRIMRADALPAAEHACGFPHEVGVFLGYPLADVEGFIENRGQGCLASGCWKVYAHEDDALDAFCRFKECERYCSRLHAGGASLEEVVERSMRAMSRAA